MADEDPSNPKDPEPGAGQPRRGRRPKAEAPRDGTARDPQETGGPPEPASPAAVMTAEPEAPPAAPAPPAAEPAPAPAAPDRNRLDLAALKEMGITKLAQVAKSLEIPGAATM